MSSRGLFDPFARREKRLLFAAKRGLFRLDSFFNLQTKTVVINQPPPPPSGQEPPDSSPPLKSSYGDELRSPAPAQPSHGPNQRLGPIQIFFRILLPILILAGGFSVMKVAGILRPAPKRETKVAGPPRVRTIPIEEWEETLTLDVDGSVVPFREVSVTAEVAGRIISKSDICQAGKFVKAGTLLYEINPIDFNLKKQQLTKEVRQAEINLHQTDVEMENYRSLIDLAMEDSALQGDQVARLQRLVSDGASSPSEYDKSRRTEIAARNSLEQLKNSARLLVTKRASQESAIEVAASKLEQAELDLKRTKVTAPIDGVIVTELIQKDAFVPVGTKLVTIEDTSSVEILCNLRSEHLFQVLESRSNNDTMIGESENNSQTNYELPRIPATVIYEVAGRRFAWDGRLDRYDGLGLDPKTRTVPVRIVVKDPQSGRELDGVSRAPALVRGMFVTVALNVDTQSRQLAKLPTRALRPGNVIYRLIDGKLIIENVQVARLTPEYAVLETVGAEFNIGDAVVTTPIPSPKNGMRLDLVKQAGSTEDGTTDSADSDLDSKESGDEKPADDVLPEIDISSAFGEQSDEAGSGVGVTP